jgi:hypothetical protein
MTKKRALESISKETFPIAGKHSISGKEDISFSYGRNVFSFVAPTGFACLRWHSQDTSAVSLGSHGEVPRIGFADYQKVKTMFCGWSHSSNDF